MLGMDYNDVARLAGEAVPGQTVEARIVDGEGVVVSVEEGSGDGGDDLWHVSYVEFVTDAAPEEGPGPNPPEDHEDETPRWRVEVRYHEEHDAPYEAGKEAGELMTHLPKPAFFAERAPGADDPVGRKAWEKRKLEKIRRRARREATEELVEEARKLKAGELAYPPEESVLAQVLEGIDRP